MTKGQHIIELLKGVNPDTLWGVAIHKVVATEHSHRAMDLVIDLRSQARDNPAVMREILGDEAFHEIMSI